MAVPPLLPYEALKEQLDLYRAKCAEYGTTPDIVWIHACYIDDDRDTRAARGGAAHARLPRRQRVAADRAPVPPVDELNAAGYGFYTAGIMEKLAATPYDEMIAGDIVWVGTPEDVIERIGDDRGLRGADRDRDHDEPRRRRRTGRRSRRRSSSPST